MSTTPVNTGMQTGLAPGQTISKYNIIEMIGQGGSAIVWKAVDPVVNRFVAIKHLTTEGLSKHDQETLKEAFHTESRMIKSLADHPHLVQILEFIDDPRGLFIIMEYVDGASAEQVLSSQSGPVSEREALGMIAAAATALQHIHAQSIIHRDIKPANLLIPQTGGLKICDFGLSTLIADQEQMDLGTVRYMAPECFSSTKVDPRADIYSLGLIAYELLAGRAKFEEVFKMVLRDERHQAMRWMKWHTNPRTVAPALHTIDPEISQGLSDIVARMMEKDPQQRFGSAEELLDAFKRYFAGEMQPSQMSPADAAKQASGTAHATAKIQSKSKLPLILGAFVLVQCIGVGIYFINKQMKKNEALRVEQQKIDDQFIAAKGLMDDGKWFDAQEAFFEFTQNLKYQNLAELGMIWCDANLENEKELKKPLLERDFTAVIKNADLVIVHPETGNTMKSAAQKLSRESQRTKAVIAELLEIQLALNDKDFPAARYLSDRLNKQTLHPDEAAVFRQITGGIDSSNLNEIINTAYQEALAFYNNKEYEKSITKIEQTTESYGEYPELTELKNKITRLLDYNETVKKARQAENRGQFKQAVALYVAADRKRDENKFADVVKTLRIKIGLEDGLAAEQAGNYVKARQEYAAVLDMDPGNKNATKGMTRMANDEKWQNLFARGEDAFNNKEWSDAIDILSEAKAMKPNGEISAMIRESKDRIKLEEAYDLAREEKLDASLAILRNLTDYPEANSLMRKVEVLNRVKKLINAGDVDLQRGDHANAIRNYSEASKVDGIPDTLKEVIKERMHDAEYEDLIDKAARAFKVGSKVQLKVASGHAEAAYRIRRKYPNKDQKKIMALIDEIKTKLDALKKEE